MPSSCAGCAFGLAAAAAAVFVCAGAVAQAQGDLSRDEALRLAFPGADVRAERVFLTADQQQRAARLAGVEVPSALVARYVVRRNGITEGRAYVDTHTVRTKRQSLLISLSADGRVRRVDVVAFLEPAEYRAPSPWLDQYRERALEPDVAIHRAIRPLAGATLTARVTNEAVRRALAIDRVVEGTGGDAK